MSNPRVLTAPTVTQSGSITSASPIVTGLTTTALEGALRVRGAGIPRDTLVKSIDNAGQVTLTKSATATNAAASLTFGLEPLTLAVAKEHLYVDVDFHDRKVASLITAARQCAERWYGRSLLTTSLRYTLADFVTDDDDRIPIPWGDVIAVSSLSYVDGNGTTQTLAAELYDLSPGAPGLVSAAYGTSWPHAREQPDSVTIDFTAGYGPTAEVIGEDIKAGLLLFIGHLFENREATVTSSIGLREAPLGVRTLLAPLNWGRYA